MNYKKKKSFIKIQFWLNYWNLLFWFSLLGFLINSTNLLNLFLYSEITWLVLYNFSVFTGITLDDINTLSTTFFILALAGLEFAVGFLLIILLKNFNHSLIFENDNNNQISNKTNTQNYPNNFTFLFQ